MTRVLTALVLIAILIITIWFLPPSVSLALAAVAGALAAFELGALSAGLGAPAFGVFLAGSSALVCIAFAMRVPQLGGNEDALVLVLFASIIATGAVLLASGPPTPASVPRAALSLMAPVYIGLPLGTLSAIQYLYGPRVLTVLIALIAVSDSAQYYTGRALGRRKLAPSVSPAKTVEGALGGLVAATVIGATLGARWIPGVTPASGALLGATLGAFGILGDLFESLMKRGAGVKDSSALIPGHGGVLDRIDSALFVAPVYYVFLRYIA